MESLFEARTLSCRQTDPTDPFQFAKHMKSFVSSQDLVVKHLVKRPLGVTDDVWEQTVKLSRESLEREKDILARLAVAKVRGTRS